MEARETDLSGNPTGSPLTCPWHSRRKLMAFKKTNRIIGAWRHLLFAITVSTSACGGGGGSNGNTPPSSSFPSAAGTLTLSATITGLTRANLILANGDDAILVPPNTTQVSFNVKLSAGTAYAVRVTRQPFGFEQACEVGANAKGTMATSDISVTVTCGRATSDVRTLAGDLVAGNADGPLNKAGLAMPQGLATDASGLTVYVADTNNSQIRKITASGVTTLAGSNSRYGHDDGTGVNALFYNPHGVAVDAAGNVYVADSANNMIRKVTPSGVVTTVAGSPTPGHRNDTGAKASFYDPWNLAVDGAGNLIVADTANSMIRKVTPAGVVTTVAGVAGVFSYNDGPAATATFDTPSAVAVDKAGNIYVADAKNNAVRKITPGGMVSTLAGGHEGSADGTGTQASFKSPYGISIDALGNLYVVDSFNNLIRRVTPAGVVTTIAGNLLRSSHTDGIGSDAGFSNPLCAAVNAFGEIFVCDGNMVRIVQPVLAR
jgi:sugar lactone lactonase YvrE